MPLDIRGMPLVAAGGAEAGAGAPQPLGGRRILSLVWGPNGRREHQATRHGEETKE